MFQNGQTVALALPDSTRMREITGLNPGHRYNIRLYGKAGDKMGEAAALTQNTSKRFRLLFLHEFIF